MKFKNWLNKNVEIFYYDEPFHETLNWATHALGSILTLVGFILCLIKNYSTDAGFPFSIFFYCLCMFILYTASSIYHGEKNETIKRFCRLIDHSSVYILIAGTYTPLLLYPQTTFFNIMLAIVWFLTITGIIFTLVFWGRFKIFHIITYLMLGWFVLIFAYKLFPLLNPKMIIYMILGGVIYSLGIIFYGIKKIPYNHAIWHIFVLGGSVFFFIGIYLYLI